MHEPLGSTTLGSHEVEVVLAILLGCSIIRTSSGRSTGEQMGILQRPVTPTPRDPVFFLVLFAKVYRILFDTCGVTHVLQVYTQRYISTESLTHLFFLLLYHT